MDRTINASKPNNGLLTKKSTKQKNLTQVILRLSLATLFLIGSGTSVPDKFCTAPEYNSFVVEHLKAKSKDKVF